MKSFLIMSAIVLSANSFAEGGLKKVNYQNETSDSKSQVSPESSGLSPEDAKKMMAEIEVIKQKQAEQQKALEELDKEE